MDTSSWSIWAALIEFVANLRVQVRAALAVGIDREPAGGEREQHVDPDFEGWLRGDPMVTGDAASQYHSRRPGSLTRNGRGSLEVGAAED